MPFETFQERNLTEKKKKRKEKANNHNGKTVIQMLSTITSTKNTKSRKL